MADSPRIGVGVIIRKSEEILFIRRYGVHGSNLMAGRCYPAARAQDAAPVEKPS